MRVDPVTEAYRDEAWGAAARQMPLGLGVFVAMLLTATALELLHDPTRLAEILLLDALAIAVVAWVGRAAREPTGKAPRAALAGTIALGLLLNGYGAAVGGSAEMCVVNLSILLGGTVLLCPWGWRGQALANLGALGGYPLAVLAGMEPELPLVYGAGGLLAIAGLTIRGAGLIESYRLKGFRTMAELRAREARLQSYFDLALVGMGTISPDRGWLEANDEICRMLGRSRGELLRRPWETVVHPDDREGVASWLAAARAGSSADFRGELRLLREAGGVVHASVALRAQRRPGGAVDSIVALLEDSTEHRRAEEELRAAKEQAEAANRSKSDFLATMSHEIRTPMNLIFGMTEMALDSSPNPQQREYLRKTRAAAGTLQVLLNDVLDFSKIEAGKLGLRPREFALREWLEESLGPLTWLAREKGLEVACEVAPSVPETVLGDPDRLGQVIVNLVSNAIKFTDHGAVRVSVTRGDDGARAGAAGTDPASRAAALYFSVVDSGIGIATVEQQRIFDAFAQAGHGEAPSRGGAGLGLAICARLVDLMGGRIWVESDVGRGSRFHFTARFEVPEEGPRRPG